MTREEYRAEYERIRLFLKEKDADFCEIGQTEEYVSISIDWGDWKHSHAYLDYLMKELGFSKCDEEITEEDGSDCYSSIHYYKRA